MISFESEIIIALVLCTLVVGILAPYVAKSMQYLGVIEIDGNSSDDLSSNQ
jgi:hypothetical protein